MAFIGALTQLIPPLALNKITDYMETYDSDKAGDGVPLVVVGSVAGLFLGQVRESVCVLFCCFFCFAPVCIISIRCFGVSHQSFLRPVGFSVSL